MAHIKINYDGLQQQSAAMRNCIQNYESLISRTQALVNEISSGWQGEASVAYVESMSNYLQQVIVSRKGFPVLITKVVSR